LGFAGNAPAGWAITLNDINKQNAKNSVSDFFFIGLEFGVMQNKLSEAFRL
jgi:hypothetical protein